MIRLAELALFLAPLAAYILWRVTVTRGQQGPSPALLSGILVGLLGFGAGLAWFGVRERFAASADYVPAVLQDGRVVQGHGLESAPEHMRTRPGP
jgi:uncharacterized RDD family membrane protein YckC